MKIVVADDETDVREAVADHLTRHGHEVLPATNGLEALLHVKHERPGAVILDLDMPRLGGLEALKRIRGFDKSIAVVVLAPQVNADVERQAAALGARAVLPKPVDIAALLAALGGAASDVTSAQPTSSPGPSTAAAPPAPPPAPEVVSAPPASSPVPEAAAAPPAPALAPSTAVAPPAPPPEAASAAPARGAVGRAIRTPGSGARVLIIDDDDAVREVVAAFLAACGYEVSEAARASAGTMVLADISPDVILLDIDMPGLSGADALPTIRAMAPRAIIIMVSGTNDEEVARRTLGQGANDYVVKPIDFDYLAQSLETALASRSLG